MFIGRARRRLVDNSVVGPGSRALLALVVVGAALLTGCEPAAKSPAAAKPDEKSAEPAENGAADGATSAADTAADDKAAVELQIMDYAGIEALIKSYQGKVVVMDAWSTWCEPCLKEFPGLVALHKKHGPDKVACISLSFDYEGGKKDKPENHVEDVLAFLTKQGATFDNIISNEPSEDLYKKFELTSVPAVFVFDRDGMLAKRYDGNSNKERPFSYADVDTLVGELLAD